jgi:hypothetical protein
MSLAFASQSHGPVRIETIPLILGILIGLLGIGIIFDAWSPDTSGMTTERRRRPRIERHRNGEALIGFGVLALAAAFIGRDNWRYSVLVVIIGAVFLLAGAILNGRYVRELFMNRGPLRRREEGDAEFVVATPNERAVPPIVEQERDLMAARDEVVPETDVMWDGVERRKEPRVQGKRGGSRPRPGRPTAD